MSILGMTQPSPNDKTLWGGVTSLLYPDICLLPFPRLVKTLGDRGNPTAHPSHLLINKNVPYTKTFGGGGNIMALPSPLLGTIPYRKVTWKKGSVAEQFKALTHNPEVSSSSPLPVGHAGVNSLLASLPASWGF